MLGFSLGLYFRLIFHFSIHQFHLRSQIQIAPLHWLSIFCLYYIYQYRLLSSWVIRFSECVRRMWGSFSFLLFGVCVLCQYHVSCHLLMHKADITFISMSIILYSVVTLGNSRLTLLCLCWTDLPQFTIAWLLRFLVWFPVAQCQLGF